MTVHAYAEELDARLPSQTEQAAANQLRRILAPLASSGEPRSLKLRENDAQTAEVILTPALSRLLMELLRHVGSGNAVTIVPVSQMLTTQQAADVLNVSRPFLISLLEKGDIPHTLVGRHRRIRAEDLFTYKRERDDRRDKALATLAVQDAELF